MDNETIKEICDDAEPEIVRLVHSILADMKPELAEQIGNMIFTSAVNKIHNDVAPKLRAYEERINELESKIALLSGKSPDSVHQPIQRAAATAVDGVNTLSAEQIEEILSFPELSIESNGWIYYYKLHHNERGRVDYGEIFKVRTDGTQNQKIFKGKAHGLFTNHFRLKGNMLYFQDIDAQDRAIKV